ncbi:Rep family protein [Paratractidigestivibacter sp.]|uniref:Rep family protein n=1 Tax=Paratractidigestivibacter sp. TaxID=2847316 RepID=UPI002ACB09AF|nr:Rep family protein [Paratractidigestivibacter sp.]
MAKVVKLRAMMYEQQIKHLPCTIDELRDRVDALGAKRYGGITHDQDVADSGKPAEDHVHVMLEFKNPRSLSAVAKALGDKPQQIAKWDNGVENGFSYLCHRTTNARDRHQYDPSLVWANFDYPAFLSDTEKQVVKASKHAPVRLLLDDLREGRLTKDEVIAQLSGADYARAKRQIEDVHALWLHEEAERWRRDMVEKGTRVKTIWLFGGSGTGKTNFARHLAEEKGGGYFVSGSTRDVFQGYQGQHTIILDELRPESLPYSDLLRITDPNSISYEVMAPARYSDKPLAADLIIVTSPFNPWRFYREQVGQDRRHTDMFDQMARRLSLVVRMEMSAMWLCKLEPGRGYVTTGQAKSNPYSAWAAPQVPASPADLFDSLTADCPPFSAKP